MYGKIFEQIYDGTLAENWQALITFQQMIVLCDADGILDMTPQAISRRTGIPIEHIEVGIEFLERPDPYSRTPDEDGKRIVRLDEHRPWGWYVVNHKKYKFMKDSDEVREQNRLRKQKQRQKDKVTESHTQSQTVTESHEKSRYTDTDTNIDTDKKTFLSDSNQVRLSEYLFKHIKRNNPKAKQPNIQVWAKHIDKAIRIDGRSVDDLKSVIEWCQKDSFWASNILSTSKLRDKFDQLWVKMKPEKQNCESNNPPLFDPDNRFVNE